MGYIKEVLQRGQVPGMLTAQLRAVDGREELTFDTTGRRSLAEAWGSSRIGSAELRALALAATEVLRQSREYLLPPEGVELDPTRIYVNEEGSFSFVYRYLPAGNEKTGEISLAKFLLARLDRTDQRAVLAGYEFFQRAGEGVTAIELFRQLDAACGMSLTEKPDFHNLPDNRSTLGDILTEGLDGGAAAAEMTLPDEEERQRLLDAFFEDSDEEPEHPRIRVLLRPKLWQQRILIGAGMVIAAAVVVGMAAGDAMIGAGCTLIAGAVAAYAWLRRARGGKSGRKSL